MFALSSLDHHDLVSYRDQFDSLKGCYYLISNSLGAMPNRVADQARKYTDAWKTRGVRAWDEQWWMLAQTVGDEIGVLIGADPGTVSMHPNVTTASAVALSCFNWTGPRKKVVMVEMEFPSMLYLYREWLRDSGTVEIVECPDAVTVPTERVVDAIDEQTALVPISHVLFRSSFIVDVNAIVEKAHRVGAKVVLDVFQSAGTVPVNVGEWNVDIAVGGCLKWLCGGPGSCFLYVRPDLARTLKPRFTGWFAHAEPFEFNTRPIQYAEGARRFMNGTSNVPALHMCRPGIEIISEIGVDRKRMRSQVMTARLISGAQCNGWSVTAPSDPDQLAGTVAIDVPFGAAVSVELNARNFLVDYRPKAGIRISPHFYNTDQELDNVIGEIAAILNDKSYERHLTADRTVT